MKKLFLPLLVFFTSVCDVHAQGFKDVFKNNNAKDTSANKGSLLNKVKGIGGTKNSLTSEEIISGLKEALTTGTQRGTQKLSAVDGFFKDAALKILMPEEAVKAEKKLRNIGMGSLVDNAILSMNRAAEDAAKEAAPIFLNAIKGITIQDGLGILKGGNNAATEFLKGRTVASLTEAFRPVVENSLKKVDATKHWNLVFSNYNKVSIQKVNPDLAAYVTEKALAGIFYQVGQEELKIRKDPAARATDLLKKVFAE
ncbi:MAG TPA: DUF4197 domain-containing protein [Flavisolibacter sp.]|nr:DUF4197 domain-containing protein [Flavisolibacter sp.]